MKAERAGGGCSARDSAALRPLTRRVAPRGVGLRPLTCRVALRGVGLRPFTAGWRQAQPSVPSPTRWHRLEWGSIKPRPGLVSLGGGGSVVSDSVAPGTAARQASLFFTISWSSLRLLSVESVMPPSRLILLSAPSPSASDLSQHQSLFQ